MEMEIELLLLTASVSGSILILTAKVPGISFTYTATSTLASIMETSIAGDIANDNYVTLTGDPDPVTSATTYFYTIETTGTACSTAWNYLWNNYTFLQLQVLRHQRVAGTDAQEVCEGVEILPVSFKVYGGAVSLTIQLNGGFDQLPPGITQSFTRH